MSRPSSGHDEKGVNQNGDPGGHHSVFTNTHSAAAASSETKLLSAFKTVTQARKVYLGGREYYSEEGKTFELRLVGKIKQQLSADPTFCPEYPSSLGLTEFTRRATEVALGKSSPAIVENRAAGIEDIREYYYWDDKQRGVCLEKLLEDLERAPEQSVVVLSASAHYPTGADLTQKQWTVITQLIMALCYGDLNRDAWPIQHFVSQGMELLCAQSFSHCFGLYGEAVGHLLCILKQNSPLLSVQSQADRIVKSLWAQPSVGGAHVVAAVLSNPAHLVEWQGEVKRMVERCMLIRDILREKLRLLGTPGCWDHLTQQGGLFCCTGLNDQQVEFLSRSRHVYLLPSGCLNVSAINGHNLEYVTDSIHLALTTSL